MSAKISLRPFVSEDAGRVVELLQDVSFYRPDQDKLKELAHIFLEQKEKYACVAEKNGYVVGFGSLFILTRIRGGSSAVIEDLAVSVEVRGQGIGRLILEDLLAHAKERGCFKVSLEASEIAEDFYRAVGFEIGCRVMKYRM